MPTNEPDRTMTPRERGLVDSLNVMRASNDRLHQENLILQERNDHLEEANERLSTQLARYMGYYDQVVALGIQLKVGQWTPTTDGSGRSEEAGW